MSQKPKVKGKINDIKLSRPNGENIIKTDVILGAWHSYCMESRLFRIMRQLGLRN